MIVSESFKLKAIYFQAVKYCPEVVKLAQLAGSCKGVGSVALDLFSSISSKIRASVEVVVNWHLMISLKKIFRELNPGLLNIYGTYVTFFVSV